MSDRPSIAAHLIFSMELLDPTLLKAKRAERAYSYEQLALNPNSVISKVVCFLLRSI
jgi:hypothetical protein